MCSSGFVSLKGACHFYSIAIIGGYKISTHENQNNASGIELLFVLSLPFSPSLNIAIKPASKAY